MYPRAYIGRNPCRLLCFCVKSFIQSGRLFFINILDGNPLIHSHFRSSTPSYKAIHHMLFTLDINFGLVRFIRWTHRPDQSSEFTSLYIYCGIYVERNSKCTKTKKVLSNISIIGPNNNNNNSNNKRKPPNDWLFYLPHSIHTIDNIHLVHHP
jgi:hypothetical protein